MLKVQEKKEFGSTRQREAAREKMFRELTSDRIKRHRKLVKHFDEKIKGNRAQRRAALAQLRRECRECEAHKRSSLAKMFKRATDRLRERYAKKKAEAVQRCKAQRIARVGLLDTPIRDLLKKRAEEIATFKETRKNERYGDRQNARKGKTRSTLAERKAESDDAVLQEIPERLIPLWMRVKSKIRGSKHLSRGEAFLHFAEEHPDEALAAIEADVEAEMRAMAEKADGVPAPASGRWLSRVAGNQVEEINERPLSTAEARAISCDAEALAFEVGDWAA